MAGELRDRFEGYELQDFEVQQVENSAPAVWIARGAATVNRVPDSFDCRWISEDPEGRSGFEDNGRVAPPLRAEYLGRIGVITESRRGLRATQMNSDGPRSPDLVIMWSSSEVKISVIS